MEVRANRPQGAPQGGVSIGSGADSFIEYLLKDYLLDRDQTPTETQQVLTMTASKRNSSVYQQKGLELFQFIAAASRELLVDIEGVSYLSTAPRGNRYEHLLCYLPGVIAVATGAGHLNGELAAREMVLGCCATYYHPRYLTQGHVS